MVAVEKLTLESIDKTLKEILKWTRFANLSKLKEVLTAELDAEAKKLVYEASDGSKGLRDVATECGVPWNTVHGWWEQWFRMGIVVESDTRKGRMVKIVSLVDLGMKLPKTGSGLAGGSQPEASQPSQDKSPTTPEGST